MLIPQVHLANKPKPVKGGANYLAWTLLCLILLSLGSCWCRNPQDPPEVLTPKTTKKTLTGPKSDIQLTVSKTLLQGADHTFTLHLQHTGAAPSLLDAHTLGLTLQEGDGVGSTLTYPDASNIQQTASSPQKLTYFTTQTELDTTNPTLVIPITLQPGTDVKKVTITVTLTGPGNLQTTIVEWQLFTPTLITDAMIQAAASNKALSGLLQKLKDGSQLSPDQKNTIIIGTVRLGNQEILKALLQISGMDVNTREKFFNSSLLYLAALKGHTEVVKLLLQNGADFSLKNDSGHFPLYGAVRSRAVDLVKLLLEKGVDVNQQANLGYTALHQVASTGKNTEIVELLLNQRADVNQKTNGGTTPLHCAISRIDYPELVEFLLKRGANVNEQDNQGGTPLYWAVEKGCEAIIKILLQAGANVNIPDKQGSTPLDKAVEKRNPAIIALLQASSVQNN